MEGRTEELDHILLFAWPSEKLDVDALYSVAFETLAAQVCFDQLHELIIDDVSEGVVVLVVQMDVLECVYIKIHLVV